MLQGWDNFFLVTGAAGAQLIGLLFVVVTLGTGLSPERAMAGIRAFMTPTLLSFASVFMQALAVLTPWPFAWAAGVVLVLVGLFGVGFRLAVLRVRRGLDFVALSGPGRFFYDAVPMLANAALVAGGGGLLLAHQAFAPFAIAAATTLMLVSGIYGAWDMTLWIIENRGKT